MNANAPAFQPKQPQDAPAEQPARTKRTPKPPHAQEGGQRGSKSRGQGRRHPPDHSPSGSAPGNPQRRSRGGRQHSEPPSHERQHTAATTLTFSTDENTTDRRGRVVRNDLLGFSLPPRARPEARGAPYRTRRSGPYVPYSKERFVNATFRFILSAAAECPSHILDSDMPVPWDDVERVIVPNRTDEAMAWRCPICLGDPAAARITKCGHVLCLACALQYFDQPEEGAEEVHLQGSVIPGTMVPAPASPIPSAPKARKKEWKRCPICWDALYLRDLRGVVWGALDPLTIGKTRAFTLIQRDINTTVTLPRAISSPPNVDARAMLPRAGDRGAVTFSRLLRADPSFNLEAIMADVTEVEAMVADILGWSDDATYARKALAILEASVQDLLSTGSPLSQASKSPSPPPAPAPAPKVPVVELTGEKDREEAEVRRAFQEKMNLAGAYESAFTDSDGEEEERPNHAYIPSMSVHPMGSSVGALVEATASTPSTPTKTPAKAKGRPVADDVTSTAGREGAFWFYQSADGQAIYLHPLDLRILRTEYGSYQAFPDQIDACVVDKQETSVTEEVRRRIKYLAHLPLTSDVTLVELDLTPLVSVETRRLFQRELQQREKARKQKQSKEKREEAKADRRMGASGAPSPLHNMGEESYANGTPEDMRGFATFSPSVEGSSEGPSPPPPQTSGLGSGTPSFARALVDPAQPGSWVVMTAREREILARAEYGEERVISTGKRGKKKVLLMSTTPARGSS